MGKKIVIPVLPSMGTYTSDDVRSCVNDDCFDLPAFANRKFKSEESPIQFISIILSTANAHHRCCAVNLRSEQSRFYLNIYGLPTFQSLRNLLVYLSLSPWKDISQLRQWYILIVLAVSAG